MKRVAITGAGCITAIGQSVDAFRDALFAGRSGIVELAQEARGDLRFTHVAQVADFVAADWLTSNQRQLAERCAQFAIAAARQALAQSQLMQVYAGDDVALVFGCSTGGRSAEEPETAKLYTKGGRVHPLTVPRSMASAGTSLVCMEHGITGPAYTLSTACASGTHALGQAFHMVRSGMVQAAVAGGHEAPLTYGFLKAWDSLGVVSPTGCAPFDTRRDGMTLAEGAAVFTLEAMDAAVARGAKILGELVGFGMSSDAHHMTQTNAEGPAAAMRRALNDAAIIANEIGYVNAHGTGTRVNDEVEAAAMRAVFGSAMQTLPVSSTKGLHGHAIGASGAMETLATMLALHAGMLPASAGLTTPDASLQLGGLLLQNRASEATYAMTNSFAFGGLNAVLVLRRVSAA